MTYRKKLIEVSLPLEAINEESAREKSIRHGHPSTLHLWWARRPLATCRAVIWSSLVDDPSGYMPDEESANTERERLFSILEKLVKWENINNDEVLETAQLEIARSVARELCCELPIGKNAIHDFLAKQAPPVLDPFAGGGSIPLEAQRLGLRAYASDLNPVAVLINKALIEIPPKFAGLPPFHSTKPGQRQESFFSKEWNGAEGLAEDVDYYGKWIRREAEKRIGHLYPKVKISAQILSERPDLEKQGLRVGDELTVIAWLWTRTIKCPNPACEARTPMVRSFWLSKNSKNKSFAEPLINREAKTFTIAIRRDGIAQKETTNRNEARCIFCGNVFQKPKLREQAKKYGTNPYPLAVVCSSPFGRIYLTFKVSDIPETIRPELSAIENPITDDKRWFSPPLYGLPYYSDLFTDRQLKTLSVFVDLVKEVGEKVLSEVSASVKNQGTIGSFSPNEYADAITTFLAIITSKLTVFHNVLSRWRPGDDKSAPAFGRQAIPMVWDFAEVNPFGGAGGDFEGVVEGTVKAINNLPAAPIGISKSADARNLRNEGINPVISTDPPYYDNIGYADLSDFFYIWLRQSLSELYPSLFSTLLTPKSEELVATPLRFNGDREKARKFFEDGLGNAFSSMRDIQNSDNILTVYYAFKQTESDIEVDDQVEETVSIASTGWETMLEGLLKSGFCITGTWPSRTEGGTRLVAMGTNALASSIVLVCRKRPIEASTITRRDFLTAIKRELPVALRLLQQGNIAPVDLAQAAIGPGMAVFSRYRAVLESDGSPMRVRSALALINQVLDEFLAEQEGEYDSDTRWALAWFEQYGHDQGLYGVAETLSKAKNTSVEGLSQAGFLEARGGKVRLLRREELDEDWDPSKDKRLTSWEAVQYLLRNLDKLGEQGAGALLGRLGALGDNARDLAYRLYTVCERKGWAQEALAYNMLVVAWPRIKEQMGKQPSQPSLLD